METTSDQLEKLRAGKACRSCRRRKVRCDIDGQAKMCRACERRGSLCIMSSSSRLRHTMQQQAYRTGADKGVLTLPEAETGTFPVSTEPSIKTGNIFLGFPTPEETGHFLASSLADSHPPATLTALLPSLQYFESLLDEPTGGGDLFSSLSCFTLPRSIVSQPGSSPVSILSSEGKKWLHKAVGEEFFNWDALSPFPYGSNSTTSFASSSPHLRRPFIPLPAKDVARGLLNTYFNLFNSFCPTFEEQDFMLRFEQQYPIQPHSSPEEWACLNAVLALACVLDSGLYTKAWLFWKNATLSWEDLFTHAPSLLSAQALLAMTLYLIGTFNHHLSGTMIPMAIRTLRGLAPPTHERVSQQFQLVLMITRALDIDHSLQTGTQPTEQEPHDFLQAISDRAIEAANPSLFDCYEAFYGLIYLKEEVYRDLYTVSAHDKADPEVISLVGQLDARLEQWKNSIPEKYRPGHPHATDTLKRGNCSDIVHLHLSYHNCLLVIHRRAAPYTACSMRLDPLLNTNNSIRSPNPRSLTSSHLCASAARASMRLVKYIPQDNPLIRGAMVNYVIFALKLLVILIVQDPRSARAHADIILMRSIEDFLSSIPVTSGDQNIPNLMQYCARYRQVAEQAITQVLIPVMKHSHGPELNGES
ncbi:hypothetical protein BDW59DRAFT_144459 [Aspergillus cavernicola]|uniref:Zn(2)-C6 fungal-type domain-containing protein n=1 Tax=Aspergillus cavernicola TaxID=176166 RepID=A0ABR4IJI8_9EURO